MGRGAVYDLAHNSPGVESITIADYDPKKAEELAEFIGSERVSPRRVDVSNHSATSI
jgi:saccharopine dehydrogenase-like NADP-dependent oxidoreductase